MAKKPAMEEEKTEAIQAEEKTEAIQNTEAIAKPAAEAGQKQAKPAAEAGQKQKEMRRAMDENVVYVGKKGTMAYVLAVVTQMNQGAKEVVIKARGKAISRAVDVAEIVKNKFVENIKITNIAISTEDIHTDEGSILKVSAIEISIKR